MSRWHAVDADEIWHFYEGAPLELLLLSAMGCTVGPGFEFADFRFISTLPAYAAHFVGDVQRLRAPL